jgi:hypothetical protein
MGYVSGNDQRVMSKNRRCQQNGKRRVGQETQSRRISVLLGDEYICSAPRSAFDAFPIRHVATHKHVVILFLN